jgi:hypothetical protein
LEKKYPDADLFYSIDEEGNGYTEVYYGPSVQYVDKDFVRNGYLDSENISSRKTNETPTPIIVIN